jgi:hypothetical protein
MSFEQNNGNRNHLVSNGGGINSVDYTNQLSEERSEVVFKNGAVYKG